MKHGTQMTMLWIDWERCTVKEGLINKTKHLIDTIVSYYGYTLNIADEWKHETACTVSQTVNDIIFNILIVKLLAKSKLS